MRYISQRGVLGLFRKERQGSGAGITAQNAEIKKENLKNTLKYVRLRVNYVSDPKNTSSGKLFRK